MSEEQGSENQVTEVQAQAEKEARLMGWVPKEEFRDGDHWVDAEAFVKRGKEINPILRKNNETLLKKLEESQREIVEVKKVAKEFEKFQKDMSERKVQELEHQLRELKEQKKTAIKESDGEAVIAIDDAIDAIKQEQLDAKAPKKEEPKAAEPVQLDPIVTTWMEENEWFTTDQKMSRVADAIAAELSQSNPTLKGKAFFDKLDEELQEVMPEKYKKKTRSSPVEGNTSPASRSGSGKKHSYESLPSDAKEACNRFVKAGLMTREQYLADYEWE